MPIRLSEHCDADSFSEGDPQLGVARLHKSRSQPATQERPTGHGLMAVRIWSYWHESIVLKGMAAINHVTVLT